MLLVLSTLISCKGKNHSEPQSSKVLNPTVEKIPSPEYGFKTGFLDSKGNLWFGSYGNGLYFFNGTGFKYIDKSDGLCSDIIHVINEDENGTMWFGTSNGLCQYDGNNFKHISLPFQDTSSVWLDEVYPVINPNAVHSLIQDQKGNFWIGTGGGGGYHYDGKTFVAMLDKEGIKYADSLQHNWIPDIMEDRNGNIWFASMSYGGLNRFDGDTYKRFLRKDGLSDDMIRKIFEDSQGRIWLGFNGNRNSALTMYEDGEFHIFVIEDTCNHKSVLAMFEDVKGKLWIGGERGVCILENNQFNIFFNDDGQQFYGVNFIIEDESRNIWIGGRFGLCKYDGDQIVSMTK